MYTHALATADARRYVTSGFLTLQSLVDEYAFENAARHGAAVPYAPPTSYALAAPMPTAPFTQNLFYVGVSYMLALVLTMCQVRSRGHLHERARTHVHARALRGAHDTLTPAPTPLPAFQTWQLFPVALLTKAVVVEKETRLKQTMRIMGLRDSV